jgi:predicted phage terminase large subunit-like protein
MPAAPALTSEDWLNIEREYCSRSMANFVRQAWAVYDPSSPLIWGWHIDGICEHLEAVTDGQITRLLINIPPGTMKSSLVNVLWPAWEWGPKKLPHHRIISAAHEQGLAIRDNRAMRRIVQSDWYQALWPMKIAGDQNQKTYFENESTGFRQACAVSSMTGRRGHRVLWDDPLSAEHANSEAHREKVIREFTETLPSRYVNPSSSANVIVMQRLHERDPSGYILEKGLAYDHLCLPMEFEKQRRCRTSIGFEDPRKDEGELLFEERFPRDVVDRDKGTMGSYAVAGQFQQLPSPRGGGIFKDAWWKLYTVLPKIKYRIIYGDTAQKTKEQNDFSVFQCWGFGEDGKIYLLDQVRGKWEAPQLLMTARAFWNKHKADKSSALRQFKVEDKSSGTGLIQQLRQSGTPVQGIPRGVDKTTRAYDVAPQIEVGNVAIPADAEWLSDYLSEFSAFPSGANDDQVDPTMDAITDMLIMGNGISGPLSVKFTI